MKPFPKTQDSIVLRTDYSDPQAWDDLCAEIGKPVGSVRARVSFVSDVEYAGRTVEQLVAALGDNPYQPFLFVTDSETFSNPERSLLVVDLWGEPGRTFRVVPSEVQSVQDNLSIANMDFEEFAEAVDRDGVFRGF